MAPLPSPRNLILIISGPAGSGKTTLCTRLLKEFGDSVTRLVTTTSREPRPGEVDGVDYHFISPEEFEERIRNGEFIEWAMVHGRYYGSRKTHVRKLLQCGKDILLNIDVQGAQSFRREKHSHADLDGDLHCIFIKPVSMEQIRERLLHRGSDDEVEIARRLRTAEREIQVADEFDHVIVSGSREEDYAALRRLYRELKHSAD